MKKLGDISLIILVAVVLAAASPFVLRAYMQRREQLTKVETTPLPAEPEPPAAEEEQEAPESPFEPADSGYFDDALFIGDSRIDDLGKYGTLKNADYYAFTGMSVFNFQDKPHEVKDYGTVTLDRLLDMQEYGKIYIMLGLNELGYPLEKIVKSYREIIELIEAEQPSAVIYIQAVLHVTAKCSKTDPYSDNGKIDLLNAELCKLADGERRFFLDANPRFDAAGGGALDEIYTSDGTHFYAKYYADWCDFLIANTAKRTKIN